MARPERMNVDYFPHYIADGKKMYIIEDLYGNDGYATWYKLLEILAKTDNHWIDLDDEANRMYVSAKCKIDQKKLLEIVESIVKLGEFNPELWKECKVIWSDKFMDSIQDAYKRRNNYCMTLEGLCKHLQGLGRQKPTKESKGDKSKVNQTKEKQIPAWEEFKDYALDKASERNLDLDLNRVHLKYDSWVENGWRNGNGKKIDVWKSTLLNTLTYLQNKKKKTDPIAAAMYNLNNNVNDDLPEFEV